MNIKLNCITTDYIINLLNVEEIIRKPKLIQYADFNVLNYLYQENFNNKNLTKLYFYPDSTALFFFIKFIQNKEIKKIVSTDLQNDLLKKLNKINANIYLFGDKDLVISKAIDNINNKHPNIKVVGSHNGYNFNNNSICSDINNKSVDVLFVGLGVTRQEKWMLENYKKLNVKIIMSVGGWFQYLSGEKKRAPLFIRKLHLEWVHKLLNEFPRVWKRYFIGIPLFYIRLFTKKIVVDINGN